VYGDGIEPNNPKSPYALTKLTNEAMLGMYYNLGLISSKRYTIIRPFTVYGPGQRDDLAITKFINAALKDEPLIIYGDGYQERDFTYVEDLCKAIKLLIYPVDYLYNGYDIGSCKSYNLYDIIRIISSELGKNLRIKYSEENIYDVKSTCANVGNLYESIGYIPNTNLQDGIRKQIEWCKYKLQD
jgi:nucleoside-diphosphate-sugar epimerase